MLKISSEKLVPEASCSKTKTQTANTKGTDKELLASKLKDQCANCRLFFGNGNSGIGKLNFYPVKDEKAIEISVYDALVYIYGISISDLVDDWDKCNSQSMNLTEDDNLNTMLNDPGFFNIFSNSVTICIQCSIPFSEMYYAHRKFNKLSTADSVVQRAVNKWWRRGARADEHVKVETEYHDQEIEDPKINVDLQPITFPTIKSEEDQEPFNFEDSFDPFMMEFEDTHEYLGEAAPETQQHTKKTTSTSKTVPTSNSSKEKAPHKRRKKGRAKILCTPPKKRNKIPRVRFYCMDYIMCCEQRFDTRPEFAAHNRACHGGRNLFESCGICDKMITYENMGLHVTRNHKSHQQQLFQCTLCNKVYLKHRSLELHMMTQHGFGVPFVRQRKKYTRKKPQNEDPLRMDKRIFPRHNISPGVSIPEKSNYVDTYTPNKSLASHTREGGDSTKIAAATVSIPKREQEEQALFNPYAVKKEFFLCPHCGIPWGINDADSFQEHLESHEADIINGEELFIERIKPADPSTVTSYYVKTISDVKAQQKDSIK